MSETVEFRCPHCGQMYRLAAEQLARRAGKLSTCRKCQQAFAFPSLEQEEPAPAPEEQAEYQAELPPAEQVPLEPEQPAQEDVVAFIPPVRTPVRAVEAGSTEGGFFGRDNMIAPVAVPILFWVLSGLTVAYGCLRLAVFARAMAWPVLVEALLWILIGPLVVRIAGEACLAAIKTYDGVREIRRQLAGRE